MSEEELIDLLKDKFDASEVVPDGRRAGERDRLMPRDPTSTSC